MSPPRAVLALALLGACAQTGPSSRTLHYIDKTLVTSPPVDHRAYGAYVQARLALDAEPPDLGRALQQIDLALRYDRDDPHLWTTRGEIELRLGDVDAARRSSARALAFGPEYPPALQLAAQLQLPGGRQVAEARAR
ncbi:tetratricopeptide repeat protein [Nannocystis pusilla]|uniref:Tetratricopeptide repeat protein n=1 Tax=Nannocystis pusilla TaxID=889268 RepID=A0A9X3ETG9_9BACT|nr:tetratricopeptide repeat protein [Nannocystis pusilla]MCY1009691.1 tetratricopeptide repeat protein [Nannocystis pusilla]